MTYVATNPFFKKIILEETKPPPPPEDEFREVPRDEAVGRPFVVLKCKNCKREIARRSYGESIWVHLTDQATISSEELTFNYSDHAPEPDVIEARGWPS